MTNQDQTDSSGARPWVALFVLAMAAVLYFARAILIPIALAILLTFLLAPVVARLQVRLRSRIASVAVVATLVIMITGGVGLLASQQFLSLADNLPTYRATLVNKVRAIRRGTDGVVGRASDTIRAIGDELKTEPREPTAPPPSSTQSVPSDAVAGVSLITSLAVPVIHVLGSGAIVVLLLVLMLSSREGIRDRVIRLAGLGNIGITTQALDDAGTRVGKYLGAHLLINAIYGVGITVGLTLIGVPNAAICGLTAGLLRFIPMLGSWLGAVVPVALSIAVFDDWSHLAMVVALFALLEMINNLVLEPWLYGTSTGLSGLGVALALVFWTWIWGPIGLVLAVPITVCLVVFSKQIPQLGALAILLGDEQVLADPLRFYQRLLCRSETEAASILNAAPADAEPAEVFDQIVIPGLAAARADLTRGLISRAQADRIAESMRELAMDWADARSAPAPAAVGNSHAIFIIPASDEFDAAAGALLAFLLERQGIACTAASSRSLLGEIMSEAQRADAPVCVVSALHPTSAHHVRRFCKTIRQRLANSRLVLAEWGATEGGTEAPADSHVHTLKQAVATVVSVATARSG